jgi:polyisoprenyl-teichoic acid--peptidoglycan teichoic acid transferase
MGMLKRLPKGPLLRPLLRPLPRPHLPLHSIRITVLTLVLVVMLRVLAGCGSPTPAPVTPTGPAPSPSITASPSPSATVSPTSTPRPAARGTPGIWENFAPPVMTPVTPIPPPLTGLVVPDEVRVLVVAGVDRDGPFSGRTDALALVIYHPRLSRASLVSIPPELFGYIPGYTMQRMYTAYAIGGSRTMTDAIEYNFGLRPDSYAVFNLDDFTQLIDDLGGINVSVLENVRQFCPGLIPGVLLMHGQDALCYMRLRLNDDEFSRNRRQQEILRTVFLRLVEGGNLVRVPELYNSYRGVIDTNLTRDELMNSIPLALHLGDPNRIGYFQFSPKQLDTWQISDHPVARVFLPNRPVLMAFMQQAVDFVTTPSPLRDVVLTLEYELTISPTPTVTYTITPTPTDTPTPLPTYTLTPTITPTRTQTRTHAPTNTRKPTRTFTITPTFRPSRTRTITPTPSVTATPSVTPTPSVTATPSVTPTFTPTDTPTP